MYGVVVEYTSGRDPLSGSLARHACQAAMVGQPGYRRSLALMADGWRRVVDLFLFADPAAARAALASDTWRACGTAHPDCRAAAPALLIREDAWGEVVLLRGKAGATRGGQACWRDRLTVTAPPAALW